MCARLGRTRLFADLECAGRQDTVLWRVTGGGVERTPAAAHRRPAAAMGLNQSISMLTIVRGARGLKSMKSTCVLASAGLPAPAGRHCCCPACAYQAVADALVLIQTGRTLAAQRILEALEKDLSEAAVLTRFWVDWVASNSAGEPQRL
jgi:hypothetical protein